MYRIGRWLIFFVIIVIMFLGWERFLFFMVFLLVMSMNIILNLLVWISNMLFFCILFIWMIVIFLRGCIGLIFYLRSGLSL